MVSQRAITEDAPAGLDERRAEFVAAMLTADTIQSAARKAHISVNTATRWLREPDVREALRIARAQVVEHAIARLQKATSRAVDTLVRNMGGDAPAAVQVRAAQIILDKATDATELGDILERLDELEGELTQTRLRRLG